MRAWPLFWRLLVVGVLPVVLVGGLLLGFHLGAGLGVGRVVLALITSAALGVGLGFWVARGIRAPLTELTAALRAWAQGDRGARVTSSDGGELGTLAGAFNGMAEALRTELQRADRVERTASARLRQRIEELDRKDQALELEKSRLEAAGLARSRWLADISHELRTPLNAITGFSDLLAGYDAGPAHREYVENIRRAASELLLLIGEILDYAKIEAGEVEVRNRPFDFYEEMEGVVTLMGRLAHARGLEFLTYLDPRIPDRLVGDSQRIRQAAINLLSNAVKFTDEGHVALEVHLQEGANPQLEFRVIDTGVGIDPSEAERLFQPFAQGGGGLHAAGTGLGLSITKYFVERLGGEAGCSGKPGEGSTFWFRVPVAMGEEATPYHRREPLQPLRVLCYDRNGHRARYTGALLRAWGVSVEHAAELGDFRSRYAQGGHDAILYFLNRSDVDTDLQVSIGDLSQVPAPKYFFHAAEHHDAIQAKSGFHHLSTLVSPRRLHRLLTQAGRRSATGDVGGTATAGEEAQERGLGGLRVLIADDNELNRHLLGVYVSRNDGEALFAEDGLAALEVARAQPPDVALLDLNMPRLSGPEALVELRREFPDLRIVAVTAETHRQRLSGLRDQGFDAVLIKPVSERRLLGTLAALRPAAPRARIEEGVEVPVLDTAKAIRLTGGKPELAQELYRMLLADLKAKREQLAFRAGPDREQLRALAHRIQGGARYCAAERVQRAARRLERAAEPGGSEAEIESALSQLQGTIDELLRAPDPYERA